MGARGGYPPPPPRGAGPLLFDGAGPSTLVLTLRNAGAAPLRLHGAALGPSPLPRGGPGGPCAAGGFEVLRCREVLPAALAPNASLALRVRYSGGCRGPYHRRQLRIYTQIGDLPVPLVAALSPEAQAACAGPAPPGRALALAALLAYMLAWAAGALAARRPRGVAGRGPARPPPPGPPRARQPEPAGGGAAKGAGGSLLDAPVRGAAGGAAGLRRGGESPRGARARRGGRGGGGGGAGASPGGSPGAGDGDGPGVSPGGSPGASPGVSPTHSPGPGGRPGASPGVSPTHSPTPTPTRGAEDPWGTLPAPPPRAAILGGAPLGAAAGPPPGLERLPDDLFMGRGGARHPPTPEYPPLGLAAPPWGLDLGTGGASPSAAGVLRPTEVPVPPGFGDAADVDALFGVGGAFGGSLLDLPEDVGQAEDEEVSSMLADVLGSLRSAGADG